MSVPYDTYVEPVILSAGPHSDKRAKRKSHTYQSIICYDLEAKTERERFIKIALTL
jgi:hypothetical protein